MAEQVAAVHGGQEIFQSVGLPLHRQLQLLRGESHGDVFRVGAGFHAEAAAHIAHHHAHLLQAQAGQAVGQRGTLAGGHLGGQAHGQSAIVQVGQHRARFDGAGRQALVHQVQRHTVRGRREGRDHHVGLAVAHFSQHIARGLGTDLGRAGCDGVGGVADGWQRVNFNHHRIGRRPRAITRGGHHGDDGLAHEAHEVHRQRTLDGRAHGLAVGTLEAGCSGYGQHAGRFQIGTGVDAQHAGHGGGACGVDADDAAVRAGRTHEAHVDGAGGRHVVGVAALALHQGRVFNAAHRLAAAEARRHAGVRRLREISGRVHAASLAMTVAACCTAATMLT